VKLPDNVLAGVEDVTVEAEVWIDPNQGTPYFLYGLGNSAGGAGNGYLFSTGDAYRTSIATGNWTTEQTANSGSNLTRGRWSKLTYTLTDGTATIYLDGAKVGTKTGVTVTPGDIGDGTTTANNLGRSVYSGDKLFKGQYREFALWNRALSESEVLTRSGSTDQIAGVSLADPEALKVAPIVENATKTVTFPVKRGTDRSALARRRGHLLPRLRQGARPADPRHLHPHPAGRHYRHLDYEGHRDEEPDHPRALRRPEHRGFR
jgi:hypothetical protein